MTETTPSAPTASMGSVKLSSPERIVRSVRAISSLTWSSEPAASLTATIGPDRRQPLDRLGLDVAAGPRGDVVENQRHVDALGDRGEMAVHPFLIGPIVVRSDREGAVGPGPGGESGQPDRLGGGVRARAGHDLGPAGGRLDHDGDHPLVFLVRQRRRFAGRAHRAQDRRPLGDVPLDQPRGARPRRPPRPGTASPGPRCIRRRSDLWLACVIPGSPSAGDPFVGWAAHAILFDFTDTGSTIGGATVIARPG